MPFFVYILKCADDSFYVGFTDNLDERMARHHDGRGSTYTAKRRPVSLVYSETYASQRDALERERQLKRWTRAKKKALTDGNMVLLNRL